jgi:RND family efflux transporter MFP subunit
MNRKLAAAAVVVVVAAAFGAWRWTGPAASNGRPASGPTAPAGAASAARDVVSVSAVAATRRDFPVLLEATGTVTALNSVDVKPQVSSIVTKVHIREGQAVKGGDLLFTLDARSDEANVVKAQAQLQKDLASLADAQRQLARSRELLAQNFVSEGAVDTNQAQVEAQQAAVAADRAVVEAARVALSYSRIATQSAGRAGAISVFPGSTVQPTSPAMVTITQLDPIAIGFSLPQRNLSDLLGLLRAGGGTVTAVLPEDRGTLTGKLQFVDNNVDAATGTVRVKAVFGNRDEKLWPGAFVGVRLIVQTLKDAVVVPQAAIVQGARGRIVYIIEGGNRAAARPVEIVHAAGPDAVITGVQPGERVIVDGRQNVRPGVAVAVQADDAASGARGRRNGAAAAGTASGVRAGSGGVEGG